MATQKTLPTDSSVTAFLDAVPDEKKRADSYAALRLMQEATGYPAVMWGPGIVGFGSYHYKYASGHEGDAPLTGFSPRKNALTFYVLPGGGEQEALLQQLGKYKAGKGCLYEMAGSVLLFCRQQDMENSAFIFLPAGIYLPLMIADDLAAK